MQPSLGGCLKMQASVSQSSLSDKLGRCGASSVSQCEMPQCRVTICQMKFLGVKSGDCVICQEERSTGRSDLI